MTAKTLDEALAAEAVRGAEHIASIRAEGFRLGIEAAARIVCAYCAIGLPLTEGGEYHEIRTEGAWVARPGMRQFEKCLARRIRSLPVPEMPHDR